MKTKSDVWRVARQAMGLVGGAMKCEMPGNLPELH